MVIVIYLKYQTSKIYSRYVNSTTSQFDDGWMEKLLEEQLKHFMDRSRERDAFWMTITFLSSEKFSSKLHLSQYGNYQKHSSLCKFITKLRTKMHCEQPHTCTCVLCIGMLVDDFCHSLCAFPFAADLRYTFEIQKKKFLWLLLMRRTEWNIIYIRR